MLIQKCENFVSVHGHEFPCIGDKQETGTAVVREQGYNSRQMICAIECHLISGGSLFSATIVANSPSTIVLMFVDVHFISRNQYILRNQK